MKEFKEYIFEKWESFFYFFFYVMNDKDIMSHGGSIPGWISDNNFMEIIKMWHEKN